MPRVAGVYQPVAGTPVPYLSQSSSANFNSEISDLGTEITNSLARDGTSAMLANFSMAGFLINNLGAPVASGDAANKSYVDTATLARNMNSFPINNLLDPTNPQDAATKHYVDNATGNRSMTGYVIQNHGTPLLPTDVATKSYVDNMPYATPTQQQYLFAIAAGATAWLNQ